MRKLLLTAAFVLAVPALSPAAPCVPGSLSAYMGLGAGCQIGGATVGGFTAGTSLGPGSPTAIQAGAILVTPSVTAFGPQLLFGFAPVTATLGQNFGVLIGYSISGTSIFGAGLSMNGSFSGNGAATAVQDLCLGGIGGFDPSNPFTCTGNVVSQVAVPGFGNVQGFASVLSIDVGLDIQLDAVQGGFAQINSVTNQFAVNRIPEPSALFFVSSGLLGLWVRRRTRI